MYLFSICLFSFFKFVFSTLFFVLGIYYLMIDYSLFIS